MVETNSAPLQKDNKKLYLSILAVAIIFYLFIIPVTVPYTVNESYQTETPLSYSVISAKSGTTTSGLNWIAYGYAEVKNTDTEPGTFTISCKFKTLRREFTPSERGYILPGETKRISCNADTDYGEDFVFTYTVTPSTKTETRYRDVTKYRQLKNYNKIFGYGM